LEPEDHPPSSAEGGLSIFALSETVQAVDMSEEGEHEVWHSTPTQAMSDDEIMAILAHELGHAAMHDVEQNMIVQAVTSFMTFGTLGWMVQSPLLAMSMGLLAPIGHIAVFAYEHAVGPSLDMCIKFVTDGITRRKEYIADAYAAKVSKTYATGLQTALAKLVVNSNQDPDEPWFYEALHADHPTLANRWANIAKVKKELYPPKEDDAAEETVEKK
jgi:STE24 endopeptidase